MLDHKEGMLQGEHPHCRYEGVRLDLADAAGRRALFQRVSGQARKPLVISEGLLVYLDAEQVAELAQDLADQPNFALWLMDLASPALLKMLERNWAPTLRAGNAPMKFAPAESTRFFEPFGWHELEYRSMFDESIRLKRSMKLARLWKLIGSLYPKKKREEFKRFSGIALLGR